MSKPKSARYRTKNWSAYNAALRERGSLLIWLDKEIAWHAPHDSHPGRPPLFSNAAIQVCLSIKVLFRLPLRQTAGMIASLLRLAGLDWPVPDYSPLCRRQKALKVQIPYRRGGGPLNLLVDSTGIKFLGDGEWQIACWATGYDRYLAGGPEALEDRSPKPSRVWNRIPEPVREKVKASL